jgi:hypothetical protein
MPSGKRLSPAQQAKRNGQIVRDRQADMTWPQIAQKHGVSPRGCRFIYRDWMTNAGPTVDHDPVRVVDDLLRGFLTDLWEFTEAADAAWQRGNVAVVVGAVRSRMDARSKAVELLQATGRLPKDLGRLRVEIDLRFVIDQIIEVFDEYDVSQNAREALVSRLEKPALEAAP